MTNKSTEKLVTFRLNEIQKFLFEAAKTNKKLVFVGGYRRPQRKKRNFIQNDHGNWRYNKV